MQHPLPRRPLTISLAKTGNSAMTVLARPIPPLYTVYVLRSTVNHACLYIGSTPNPPRRLKQHNGEAKGGAVRTSRSKLRPWEMVALVSGFTSAVAALKFEYAVIPFIAFTWNEIDRRVDGLSQTLIYQCISRHKNASASRHRERGMVCLKGPDRV